MLLLLALLQLPPGYPGGRKADSPPPVAKPAPPSPTPQVPGGGPTPRGTGSNPADTAQGEDGGGKMRGGCKHLLERSGVSVSVENTPDGAVLRFRASDPRLAQQIAQQANACLARGGRGNRDSMQGGEGDNRGGDNNDDGDSGDDHGNGRGRGHGKGHGRGKDKHETTDD